MSSSLLILHSVYTTGWGTCCIAAEGSHVAPTKPQAKDEIFNPFPTRQLFCSMNLKWHTSQAKEDAASYLNRLPLLKSFSLCLVFWSRRCALSIPGPYANKVHQGAQQYRFTGSLSVAVRILLVPRIKSTTNCCQCEKYLPVFHDSGDPCIVIFLKKVTA